MTALLVHVISAYQRWISPALGPRCRYYPSCSTFAVTALRSRGPFAGGALAIWRLLRCHPWARGGVDFVPSRGFRSSRHADETRIGIGA